jgi:hypothetical protein
MNNKTKNKYKGSQMLRKTFKFIKSLFLLVFAILAIYALFNHNFDGYCKAEGRILTEKELIERGLKSENSIVHHADFLDEACCSVSDRFWIQTATDVFLDRLFGRYRKVVTVYYQKTVTYATWFDGRPIVPPGKPYKRYYEKNFYVDECGNYRSSTFGDNFDREYYLEIMKLRKKSLAEGKL